MNAMQIAQETKPTTIGELKQYLADLEAAWSEMDEQYLGKFDDQPLYVDSLDTGISQATFLYLAEFGLVAFDTEALSPE